MKDQEHLFIKIKINDTTLPHFKYQEYGIKGVGKHRKPIISMDDYIDHSMDVELNTECLKGLALSSMIKMGMVFGDIPPEEEQRLNSNGCWSSVLSNLDKFDPTGKHRKALVELIELAPPGQEVQAIYKYAYFAMGAVIPWFFACYLKHGDFNNKSKQNENWTENAKYFPKLIEYIKTLPFKEVGRIMFFTAYPNAGVVTHRDSIVAEHKDHNINLFFDSGWRPSFIWDEKIKEKVYLPDGARSYFFNNRDYHGVDPEPVFRYTVRIDGTFTDEMCEKLGLEDGYTWKRSYE
jgi:hypothetical protein